MSEVYEPPQVYAVGQVWERSGVRRTIGVIRTAKVDGRDIPNTRGYGSAYWVHYVVDTKGRKTYLVPAGDWHQWAKGATLVAEA